MDEIFPLVDETGRVTGSATRRECHSGSRLLHPVVHLHIRNQRGEWLLQKRAPDKDIQPGKWDTSVGGHIGFGETPETALLREAREELGITGFTWTFARSYIFESDIEREFVYTWQTVYEGPFAFDPGEITEIRFWPPEEIARNLGRGVFTPNFEAEMRFIVGITGVSL